jgi:hypothetical protein
MPNKNFEAIQRSKKAKYLMRCIEHYQMTPREVAKAIGVDTRRIRRMGQATPQLHVLHELGKYIEDRARERYSA